MKKYAALLVMPGVLALQSVFAQTGTRLKLSDAMPKPGEKITFTYDVAGSPVDGKKTTLAEVHVLDGKDYPVDEIALQKVGTVIKGSFTVPATAKAFFVKISGDDLVDNNSEKGYVYPVYKGTQPVEGAYGAEAYMLFTGMGQALGKITTNKPEALELYKKEFALYPKNDKDVAGYVSLLMSTKDAANISAANQKIADLAKTGNEKNMILARNLYTSYKKPASADSLTAVVKAKFPDGELAKGEAGLAFNKETDLTKKEELYAAYIKKYPETSEKKTIQDNYRLQLASAYLTKGDLVNYKKWADQLKDKTALAGSLNNIAWAWAQKGEKLDEAAALSKQSLDLTNEKMNSGGIPYYGASQVKKMYQNTYDTYADTYAYILAKQGNYAGALKGQQPLMERLKAPDAEMNEHYANYLAKTGNTKKATEILEASIKDGKSSDEMSVILKEIYVKDKGSDKGYDTYYAALKGASDQKVRSGLAKEMINQPSPQFALKDLEGNAVSLASLKGKIVIVDFWATWCGPCKASFPGMQLAVTKFKDNPNVKFLFVDTWENGADYVPGVKKFIDDNKYTFHVLIDEKGEDGRQSKVVSQFKVDGIPTKFVIDVNGNIRFKKVGFEGSSAALADEVSAMIDMAQHPEAVTTAEGK